MIVERLTALLGFEVSKDQVAAADRVIGGIEKKLSRLALAVAPAALAGAIGAVVKGTADRADRAAKNARAIGIETEAYQELTFAAGQAGVTQEQLDAVLPKLAAKTRQAATGNKELAKLYTSIGVSARELNRLEPDKQFERIADGISKIEDDGKRNDALLKLFEEVGPRFASLFKGGGEGIRALRAQARDLGFVISEADAERFERINDAVSRINLIRQGLQNAFSVEVSGELEGLVTELGDFLTKEGPSLRRLAREVAGFVRLVFRAMRQGLDDVREFTDAMGGAGNALKFFALVLTGMLAAGTLLKLAKAMSGLNAANLKLAASTVVAYLPFFVLAASVAFVLIALQDLTGWVEGKDSVLGRIFGEFTPEGWEDLQTLLLVILAGLVLIAGVVGGPVLAAMAALALGVGLVTSEWEAFEEFFGRGLDGLLEDAELVFGDMADEMLEAFKRGFKQVRNAFDELTGGMASDFEEFFGRGFDGFVEDVRLVAGLDSVADISPRGMTSPGVDMQRRALARQNQRPQYNSTIEQVNVDARGMDPDQAREAVAGGITDAEKRKAARAFGGTP